MRAAILADIHGNPPALDAVLADIERRGGADQYWILGDLSSIGYDPAGVLERLEALPNAIFIYGNTDRYVFTGERPDPTIEKARENPAFIPVLAEVMGSFAWTQGYLEARGWLDWLKKLPLEHRLTLPSGQRVLLVHAAPGTDDGEGLNPSLTDAELQHAIQGSDADLICVGHFHMAMDRHLNGQRIINPGSVSNPFAPDLRAAYAILTASETAYTVTFHRVGYDRQRAIDLTKRTSNPGAPYITRFLEGGVRAGWLDRWDGKTYYPPIGGTL